MGLFLLVLHWLVLLVSGYHNDGDNCYEYTSSYSLIADSGIQVITPILGKDPNAFCTVNTYFTLYNSDCSTPYYDTHPSIVLEEASDFFRSGKIEINTATPVEYHVELEACIIASYEGYDIGKTPWLANFTDWPSTFTLRICGEWLTMDPLKASYSEHIWPLNIGIQDETNMDSLGF